MKTLGREHPPLVYHYGGDRIPDYAVITLKKVVTFWPADVHLLHSSSRPPKIDGLTLNDFRDWYSPERFQKVREETQMDQEFRQGFWLHALERFFILNEWLSFTGHTRVLHAELDVRLFDHGDLFDVLDSLGTAVYMPRASVHQAGANWLYCNDSRALELIVDQFCERASEGFEMQLLARFMDEFPHRLRAVPTHTAVENEDPDDVEYPVPSFSAIRRIVDVHPLGTWMLGQDPRNIPDQPVFNHFYFEELGSEKLRQVRYHYSWRKRRLEVGHRDGPRYPVVALHVHSKIMRRAHSPLFLALYALLANQRFRSLVEPQKMGAYAASIVRRIVDSSYLLLRRAMGRKQRS